MDTQDIELGEPLLSSSERNNDNHEDMTTSFGPTVPLQPNGPPYTLKHLRLLKRAITNLEDRAPTCSSSTVVHPRRPLNYPDVHNKWFRGIQKLNTELLDAIDYFDDDNEEAKRLLEAGANANATCRLSLLSACHIAALVGGDVLPLLLEYGAEKHKEDKLGRTPLHLAVYAGNVKEVAILLGVPEDFQDTNDVSPDVKEDIKKMMDAKCHLNETNMHIPRIRMDNLDHKCKELSIPLFRPGWTPLHIASACAQVDCTRLLLTCGADPNVTDENGRTALDVAGYVYYYDYHIGENNFAEVIRLLLQYNGTFNTMRATDDSLNNRNTPLHTAVEIQSFDTVKELLRIGASVSCHNKAGLTPLHICVKNKLEKLMKIFTDKPVSAVDVRDTSGRTVLYAAIQATWLSGVSIALTAGADITCEANDGISCLQLAAIVGDLNILKEIVAVAKEKDILDKKRRRKPTALFMAVMNNSKESVKYLLNEGANMKIILPDGFNILHVAVAYDNTDILQVLLEQDEVVIRELINAIGSHKRIELKNCSPLQLAVFLDKVKCVQLLLDKGANVKMGRERSVSALFLAAMYNNADIAKEIIKYDKTTMHDIDNNGWNPLHVACNYSGRDVVTLLLKEGGDLSACTKGSINSRKTAIGLIFNNMSKPTQFMEGIFDSYIYSNDKDLHDQECKVTVDYRILIPNACEKDQMKVINALLETGNRYEQENLLLHPLVESFLRLKWRLLQPKFRPVVQSLSESSNRLDSGKPIFQLLIEFFLYFIWLCQGNYYPLVVVHMIFSISFSISAASLYYYNDSKINPPLWLQDNHFFYVAFIIFLVLKWMTEFIKYKNKTGNLETWVNIGGKLLPTFWLFLNKSSYFGRHVVTIALLLVWLDTFFLISVYPRLGHFVLIFRKVTANVMKILLMFIFVVIGFALSFMIEFKSKPPFNGFWSAFLKTVVMMMSEYDFSDTFPNQVEVKNKTESSPHLTEKNVRDWQPMLSSVIVRIIFLFFVIVASIVLMNVLVGIAVNDINELTTHGRIKRLKKRTKFISNIETNKSRCRIFPKWFCRILNRSKNVNSIGIMYPDSPLPLGVLEDLTLRLKNGIMDKVHEQQNDKEDNDVGNAKTLSKKMEQLFVELQTVKNHLGIQRNVTVQDLYCNE